MNTKSEIQEKAALCLSTGGQQFWVIDPKRKTVTITHPDGRAVTYRAGESIPLALFDSEIEIDAIFG